MILELLYGDVRTTPPWQCRQTRDLSVESDVSIVHPTYPHF